MAGTSVANVLLSGIIIIHRNPSRSDDYFTHNMYGTRGLRLYYTIRYTIDDLQWKTDRQAASLI